MRLISSPAFFVEYSILNLVFDLFNINGLPLAPLITDRVK